MAEPSPGSLQGILSGTDVTLQAQLLLELAQHLAEGKAVSSAVSEVCKVRPACSSTALGTQSSSSA